MTFRSDIKNNQKFLPHIRPLVLSGPCSGSESAARNTWRRMTYHKHYLQCSKFPPATWWHQAVVPSRMPGTQEVSLSREDRGGQAWKATQWVQKQSHAYTQLLPKHLENKNIERTMILCQALTSHSLFPCNSQWPLEESHFTDDGTGTRGEGTKEKKERRGEGTHHDLWCSHAPLGSSTDGPPAFGESLAHWRITKPNPKREAPRWYPSLLLGNPEHTPWGGFGGVFSSKPMTQ